LANLAWRDRQSVNGKNLAMHGGEWGQEPWSHGGNIFKSKFKGYIIPEADTWRDMVACDEEVEHITELVDCLCTT
jgi:hypothetical protein